MSLINCPQCKKSISDFAFKCPHCGLVLKESENINSKEENINNDSAKSYTQANNLTHNNRRVGIILISISVILIVIGIYLLNSHQYKYAVENLQYYKSQIQVNSAKTSGWLGDHYQYITDSWQYLKDKAQETIWITRISSIACFLFSIPFLIIGYKKFRLKNTLKGDKKWLL